jgi:hypothetical protein
MAERDNTILGRKGKAVLEEFQSGDLQSSNGDTVTNPDQALAIAFSEQRRADKERRSK